MIKILNIPLEDCYCGIPAFYEKVRLLIERDLSKREYTFNCTKIEVSEKIFEKIYEYYKDTESIGMDSMGMLWCCYGPKCFEEEHDNYNVLVSDGFIEYE